ncbi:hypothetical protein [Cerasicoccus frondis]|uniref:hypothetical protein n=1 Tax=Cerasicoccus frondis TaxID=490090 RepID=UPI0028526ED0|nr:hypothetical protein [Cerasicoccus frondis]
MRKFLYDLGCFLFLPACIVLFFTVLYVKMDPYQDLRSYDNYSWTYYRQALGDLSTKKLLANPKLRPDSFIFGSSRATSLYACYLEQKLPGAHFYQFAHWNDSIGGILNKLKFLDEHGYEIRNVVIALDTDRTFVGSGKPLENDHYLINGKQALEYYYDHYRTLVPPNEWEKVKFLLGDMPKEQRPDWQSDLRTNDSNHSCTEETLAAYGDFPMDSVYRTNIEKLIQNGRLYPRSAEAKVLDPQISPQEIEMLHAIRELFDQHQTNFYVFITPLYDQAKFNPKDMAILQSTFGDRLFDYSGVNEITENQYLYYDVTHYYRHISKQIIDEMLAAGKDTP